jgi:hypothetical protein
VANRTVEVLLRLVTGQYKKEAHEAADATDHLDRSVRKVDEDLNDIPPDAARAAAALKLLGGDVKTVGDRVESLGQKNASLAILESKIRDTRTEVRKLSDEFVKTGDVDVSKKIGDASGRLEGLKAVRSKIKDELEGGVKDAVTGGVRNAAQSFDLQAAAIRLGAGLVVPILAGAGGAVTALGGASIAGLGVLGAVMGDPAKFSFAWGQALSQIGSDFIDATKPFTGETYAAIASIGPMVQSWHLDQIFAGAVKYVEPLVGGVEDLVTSTVRGVGALVDKGAPAVSALTSGMTELGRAGESALTSIADGAEGGAYALQDTIHAASVLVETFGKIVQGAENAYAFIHDHPIGSAIASGGLTIPLSLLEATDNKTSHLATTELGLRKEMEAAGHQFSLQGDDLTALGQKLNQAAVSVDSLAASMVNKLFTATMGLDQAVLGVAESLTRLNDSFKENGRQLDIHSAKGQANREAILGAVTANMQLYQAQISAGMSSGDAAKIYDENTAALERNLRKAGLTTKQIDELIGKYRGIPGNVERDIAINGLTAAINGLAELIRMINGIHDKTVTVYYRTQGQSLNAPLAHGGIRRAQVGMIIPPSDPGTTLVGEPQTGGEALIPLRGITAARAMELAQTAVGGYGLDVVPRDFRGYRVRQPSPAAWAGTAEAQSAVRAGSAASRGTADPRVAALAIRAALEGMAVVMDGTTVGRLQGRQSQLLLRGG